MPAPKKPNTTAATAAAVRRGDNTAAARLRDHGWLVLPPEVVATNPARASMPGPSIAVYQVDGMRHVVSAPCGNSSTGMTATDDLAIQVRRALDHARNCNRCLGPRPGE